MRNGPLAQIAQHERKRAARISGKLGHIPNLSILTRIVGVWVPLTQTADARAKFRGARCPAQQISTSARSAICTSLMFFLATS
jgi:hypothetical protein